MKNGHKVNTANLRMLCWKRGFYGVVGLAAAIGKSRVTVHRAVKRPHQFGPTYREISKLLAPPREKGAVEKTP